MQSQGEPKLNTYTGEAACIEDMLRAEFVSAMCCGCEASYSMFIARLNKIQKICCTRKRKEAGGTFLACYTDPRTRPRNARKQRNATADSPPGSPTVMMQYHITKGGCETDASLSKKQQRSGEKELAVSQRTVSAALPRRRQRSEQKATVGLALLLTRQAASQ